MGSALDTTSSVKKRGCDIHVLRFWDRFIFMYLCCNGSKLSCFGDTYHEKWGHTESESQKTYMKAGRCGECNGPELFKSGYNGKR